MRKLAAFGCVGLLVVSVAVACSGDEHVRHLSDGGTAGLGGGGEGGVGAPGHGGGSSNPAAGSGGAGSGLGGVPEVNGNGGTGAPSPVEEGGTPSGGGGGGPALDCPAETGNFTHQCGEVETLWAPQWDNTVQRFELDVSNLPFPIATGTVSFFYANADFQQCGTVDVTVSGDTVTAAPLDIQFAPSNVRISTFSFVDVCGNHHDYDPTGAPDCNDIRGSGTGFGSYALACNTRPDINCPEACQ
jgi:hypothetical protein